MTYITTKSQNQPLNRKNASGVLSHMLQAFQDLSWTRNRCHSRRTLSECACPDEVHNRCCEFPVPVYRGTDHSARDPKQIFITPRDHVGGFHVSSEKQTSIRDSDTILGIFRHLNYYPDSIIIWKKGCYMYEDPALYVHCLFSDLIEEKKCFYLTGPINKWKEMRCWPSNFIVFKVVGHNQGIYSQSHYIVSWSIWRMLTGTQLQGKVIKERRQHVRSFSRGSLCTNTNIHWTWIVLKPNVM